jgi:glycosidase
MLDNIFGNQIEPDHRLAQYREAHTGVRHFQQVSPIDPLPGQPITLILTTSGPVPFDSARCYLTSDDTDPSGGSAKAFDLIPAGSIWDEVDWLYIRHWSLTIPPQAAGTMLRYHLSAHVIGTERWLFADNQAESALEATDFAIYVDNDPPPQWASEARVYQVFMDRFYPGNGRPWRKATTLADFYGGTVRGVIDKLDYIKSLGFNTIWLSPFFKTTSHHGYNASDYYTVEPRLGTNADIVELLEKAHALGLRMILDFVANHWSKDHPTFQDAQKDPASPYHDWYIWKNWPSDYEMYYTVKELPKINLGPGPARDEMLKVARHWLQTGFDGYRLDHANGPSHDFWAHFRRACRAIKPDCWIFGEVVQNAEAQRSFAGRMDGTLDFLLARSLRETFAFEHMTLNEFEAFLSGHEAFFPSDFIRPAFLDNHDMSRFYYLAGENKNKLKLAALLLYTLSGPPIVYNGTESGVSQERPMQQGSRYIFEEARMPMNWDAQDTELIAYFRQLNELRQTHPALIDGKRATLHLDPANGTYAYTRANATGMVLVVVNHSQSARIISVPVTGLASGADERLNGCKVTIQPNSVTLTLPAQSGAFIA